MVAVTCSFAMLFLKHHDRNTNHGPLEIVLSSALDGTFSGISFFLLLPQPPSLFFFTSTVTTSV
jgi:hypothetical protein